MFYSLILVGRLVKWNKSLLLFYFPFVRLICVRCLIAICEKGFISLWILKLWICKSQGLVLRRVGRINNKNVGL